MKQLWFIILPSDHRGWGELMDVEKRHTGRDRAFFYKKSGRLASQISGDKVRGTVKSRADHGTQILTRTTTVKPFFNYLCQCKYL